MLMNTPVLLGVVVELVAWSVAIASQIHTRAKSVHAMGSQIHTRAKSVHAMGSQIHTRAKSVHSMGSHECTNIIYIYIYICGQKEMTHINSSKKDRAVASVASYYVATVIYHLQRRHSTFAGNVLENTNHIITDTCLRLPDQWQHHV